MNLILFIAYWFWILLGIFSFFFVKFCVVDYNDNKLKFAGWLILVYLIVLFIPLMNIIASIGWLCGWLDDGHVKDSTVKWFNNLWIVKILAKEY